MAGHIGTHCLVTSYAKYPLVHRSTQTIVKGLAYNSGEAGQVVTHLLVEKSLYNFAVVLHELEHLLVVLSANVPAGQLRTHLREFIYPNVFWRTGHLATQKLEKSSA